MSREELVVKPKEEVIGIAKENGISQYQNGKRKTKEQLVNEILSKEEQKTEQKSNDDEEWQQPTVETETDEPKSEPKEEAKDNIIPEVTDEEKVKRKNAYIESVKIGTLVAFTSYTGKVKSAKVVKRSSKNRKLKVETKYGAEFIISYDDVIWVRTNKRWPKGVYQLLKGVTDNG